MRPATSTRGAAAAALAAAAAFAGCGAGGGGPVNPARAVPPEAAAYLGVVLRPRGEAAAPTGAAARALAGPVPARSVARAAGAAFLPRAPRLRFGRDVRPWLGARAGIFLLARGSAPPARGLVAVAADPAAAAAAVGRLAAGLPRRAVNGLAYRVGADGRAVAAARGFVVAGDEAAVRASLRTLASGLSLGASDRYSRTVTRGGRRRIAVLYADPARAADLLPALGVPPGTSAVVRSALAAAGADPLVAAISARPGGVVLDAGPRPAPPARVDAALGTPARPAAPLDRLPAGAAAAAASPGPFGPALADALDPEVLPSVRSDALAATARRLRAAGVPPAAVAALVGPAGAAVWLTAQGYVAAVTASSPRPAALAAAARRAVRSLGLRGITVLRGGRRVAAGSPPAAAALLGQGPQLGARPAYRAAARVLGTAATPLAWLDGAALDRLVGRGAPALVRRAAAAVRGIAAGAPRGIPRLAVAVRPRSVVTRLPSP